MKEAAQKKLLYKERQFVTGIPFSDMNKDAKTDDFVVVQGIIDVYFEEEDKIILVDYKTDRVKRRGRGYFDQTLSCTDGILSTSIGKDYRKVCKRNLHLFCNPAKTIPCMYEISDLSYSKNRK